MCVLYIQHAYMNIYINKCIWFIALKRDFESCFLSLSMFSGVGFETEIRSEQNSSVCTSSQGHFNDQIYTSNIVQVYKVTWLTRLYQQHISFLNLNANSFKCFLKKGCVQHNSGSSPTMELALQETKNRRMVLRPSKWLRNMWRWKAEWWGPLKVSTGWWFRVEGDMYSVWWACKVIWETLR